LEIDWLLVVSSLFVGACCGLVGGVISGWLSNHGLAVRIQSLEQRLQQMHNNAVSGKGVSAKAEKAERTQEAMAQVMVGVQAGKDIKEVLKEVAGTYPDVAYDIGKKVLAGKMPKL